METLKRKILGIHAEMASAMSKMATAEDELASRSSQLKRLEEEQRQLMKSVGKKENELDRITDELEKKELKIKEKTSLLKQAKEDKDTLEAMRPGMESRIEELKHLQEVKDKELTIALVKAEVAERERKSVEHVVEALETQLEDRGAQIREAKFLTDEATNKEQQSLLKLDAVKKALVKTLKIADEKERKVAILEEKLAKLGHSLDSQMARREQSSGREEMRRRQIHHLNQQIAEAENRALAEEDVMNRLEQRVKRMRAVKEKKRQT